MPKKRAMPNPDSVLLRQAIIGGAGLSLPPEIEAPPGMAMVLLYVPAQDITKRSPLEIQADLGLPWAAEDGAGVWFDEFAH